MDAVRLVVSYVRVKVKSLGQNDYFIVLDLSAHPRNVGILVPPSEEVHYLFLCAL